MRHDIRLCLRNYVELMTQSELSEKMKMLQKNILIWSEGTFCKVRLSSNYPMLIVMCREDYFQHSYAVVRRFADEMGIGHYFPVLSAKLKGMLEMGKRVVHTQCSSFKKYVTSASELTGIVEADKIGESSKLA